eukprot:gene12338-8466_t
MVMDGGGGRLPLGFICPLPPPYALALSHLKPVLPSSVFSYLLHFSVISLAKVWTIPTAPHDPEDMAVAYLTQEDVRDPEPCGVPQKEPFGPEDSAEQDSSSSVEEEEDRQQDGIRARDRERAARVAARRNPANPVARLFSSVCPYGGVLASGLNLASSSIGAGIIALPHACAVSGLGMALFYLVIVALLTVLSYTLIAAAGNKTGMRNYAQVVRALLGPGADYGLAGVLWAFSFGAEVSYVISLGDVFRAFLTNSDHVSDYWKSTSGVRVVTFLVWLGVMWPLTLPKEINSLRYFSFIAVILIVFFVIAMMAHCIQNNFAGRDEISRHAEINAERRHKSVKKWRNDISISLEEEMKGKGLDSGAGGVWRDFGLGFTRLTLLFCCFATTSFSSCPRSKERNDNLARTCSSKDTFIVKKGILKVFLYTKQQNARRKVEHRPNRKIIIVAPTDTSPLFQLNFSLKATLPFPPSSSSYRFHIFLAGNSSSFLLFIIYLL